MQLTGIFGGFMVENNVYDLYAADANTASNSRGVSMFGLNSSEIPPYLFPLFIFRDNSIRHIDLRIPTGQTVPSFGIYVDTIGTGLIEQNIIDVSASEPLIYKASGRFTHLQNKTSDGKSIHGIDLRADQNLHPYDDIESRISDATLAALL